MSNGDYVGQLTESLFLKMADARSKPLCNQPVRSLRNILHEDSEYVTGFREAEPPRSLSAAFSEASAGSLRWLHRGRA